MQWNRHSDLQGKHAFLSPSNYHWLNYDEQKLEARYATYYSARRGTDLHALAHEAIRLGVRLSDESKALSAYVNDAIGFKMQCEQPLRYSDNCFGCADTICFRSSVLRIHDLKTGITKASFRQLEIYGALFCLEYEIDPTLIDIELRIYQRDDVLVHEPSSDRISEVMETIMYADQHIEMVKASGRY